MQQGACAHAETDVKHPQPRTPDGCEECLKSGDAWVHLRLCEDCGHVGCCDSSKNRHATAHHYATKHPVIRSFQPDENWLFCYVDNTLWQ